MTWDGDVRRLRAAAEKERRQREEEAAFLARAREARDAERRPRPTRDFAGELVAEEREAEERRRAEVRDEWRGALARARGELVEEDRKAGRWVSSWEELIGDA